MTIPHLKTDEFITFLKANGCEIVCDENWNDFNRIIVKKDTITFPLQVVPVFYYYTVNKICEDIGIEPPEDCKIVQAQIKSRKEIQ